MISLGFRNFGTLTSSNSPHLALISMISRFVSSTLRTSIRNRPSLSDLSDFISTIISVGFVFDYRMLIVVSGDRTDFDFTMIFYHFSILSLVTSNNAS